MADAGFLWSVVVGLCGVLWGISLLWLNALRATIKEIDATLEDHMRLITAATNRINDARLEASEKYVTKLDLSEIKNQLKEITSDIKLLVRESRTGHRAS